MSTDKPSRNEDEYFAKRDAELLRQAREKEVAKAAEEARQQHFMKCPKDGYDLTTRSQHGVQVDVCPECGGMWLDAGELDQLVALEEQPGMLRRVVRDVMATLRNEPEGDSKAAG